MLLLRIEEVGAHADGDHGGGERGWSGRRGERLLKRVLESWCHRRSSKVVLIVVLNLCPSPASRRRAPLLLAKTRQRTLSRAPPLPHAISTPLHTPHRHRQPPRCTLQRHPPTRNPPSPALRIRMPY